MSNKYQVKFSFWYKVHIYAGLYACCLFFIAGLTALNFQHHFFDNEIKSTIHLEKTILFDKTLDAKTLASQIKDTLNEIGYLPTWEIKESSNKDTLQFKIDRPWKKLEITYIKSKDLVLIDKHRTGLASLSGGIHEGSLGSPDTWYFKTYGWYAKTGIIAGLIAASLGIYFWFKKSIKKRWQWNLIALSFLTSILILLWLCFLG